MDRTRSGQSVRLRSALSLATSTSQSINTSEDSFTPSLLPGRGFGDSLSPPSKQFRPLVPSPPPSCLRMKRPTSPPSTTSIASQVRGPSCSAGPILKRCCLLVNWPSALTVVFTSPSPPERFCATLATRDQRDSQLVPRPDNPRGGLRDSRRDSPLASPLYSHL